jgi:hypothetical protein
MPSIAIGNQCQLRYIAESTPGTTPATPELKVLRTTGRNINNERTLLNSAEVRASGQMKDLRLGMYKPGGTIPGELSVQSYDDMLEAAMRGTWAAVTIGTTGNLTPSSVDNSITRATGSWAGDGVRIGDILRFASFTDGANNGLARVVTLSSTTKIIVGDLTLVTHAAEAATCTYPGKRLDIGTTLKTFTFERAFIDIAMFQLLKGMTPNGFNAKIQPEQMITIDFPMIGLDAATPTGATIDTTPPVTAAPTNAPLAAFDGSIYEGATRIAVVTGLDIALALNRTLAGVVGSKLSPAIFEGTARTTGTFSAFLQDASLYTKFNAETSTSIWCKLNDINGTDFMNFVMPSCKYTGNNIDPPQEGGVIQNLPFEALEDSTLAICMSIQRSNT